MKDVRLVVRLSTEESESLARLSKLEGLTVSAYIRHLVARETRRMPTVQAKAKEKKVRR